MLTSKNPSEPATPDLRSQFLRSWSRFYESPTVTIMVGEGENRETFKVARDVLTSKSEVFAAMLHGKLYVFFFRSRQ